MRLEKHPLRFALSIVAFTLGASAPACKGPDEKGAYLTAKRARSVPRDQLLEPDHPIVLSPGQTVKLLPTDQGPPTFQVEWFGPSLTELGWGAVPRGSWSMQNGQPAWNVLSGYTFAFGWGPLLYALHSNAGTEGAVACHTQDPEANLSLIVQIVDDDLERYVLVNRDPITGDCEPDKYFIRVRLTDTPTTSIDLREVDTYVECVTSQSGKELRGPFDVAESDIEEFVNFVKDSAEAVGSPTAPPTGL